MRLTALLSVLLATMACDSKKNSPPATVPVDSFRSAVQRDRYEEDLRFVAKPRVPGSAHWQAVQDRCATTFEALGFDVERHTYDSGVNVVGTKPGTRADAEQVLITAHYDSVAACDGADDNASGVAGVLEAARVLAAGKFERTLKVICFDEEERGLIGSEAYTAHIAGKDRILVDFNFEMIGYRDSSPNSQRIPDGIEQLFPEAYAQVRDNEFKGDFIAVAGDERAHGSLTALARHAGAVGLPIVVMEVKEKDKPLVSLSALGRSDHRSFWLANHPALMLTDSAEYRNRNYHCAEGPDSVERLDLGFATQVVQATVGAAAEALVPVP